MSYFKSYDTNGDGKFNFEEFHATMRPLWKYIYASFLEDEGVESQQHALLVRVQSKRMKNREANSRPSSSYAKVAPTEEEDP